MEFDVIGYLGNPSLMTPVDPVFLGAETRISFVSTAHYQFVKEYLQFTDAVVHCKTSGDQVVQKSDPSLVIFRFFQSLIVPSMLNIDLSDVRNIARGLGMAFSDSDDDYREIISRLPGECRVARSALLHFACSPNVSLREIYTISKAVAWRKVNNLQQAAGLNVSLRDTKKYIRKINVKMGIRVLEDFPRERLGDLDTAYRKKIGITGILFGFHAKQRSFRALSR